MQVALFHGRGVISFLIRAQTRGNFSHAAIFDNEQNVLYEAWQGVGVRKREGIAPGPGVTLYDIPELTPEQAVLVRHYWEQHIFKKTPYDYLGVARFVTRSHRGKEFPGMESSLFCSEGAYNSLGYAGLWLFSHERGDLVSPHMLDWSRRIRKVYERL
jgi:hypothetical protein